MRGSHQRPCEQHTLGGTADRWIGMSELMGAIAGLAFWCLERLRWQGAGAGVAGQGGSAARLSEEGGLRAWNSDLLGASSC